MQTSKERYEITCRVCDSDLVSEKEKFIFLWNMLMFEIALVVARWRIRTAKKYAAKLNQDLDVFRLRQQMVKL